MKKIIAVFSIFTGFSVIGIWMILLSGGQTSEGRIALNFHLFSESLMAVVCIVGGILTIIKNTAGRITMISGLSMLMYSSLNAAGHYGDEKETGIMLMFVILFLLSLTSVTLLFKRL